MLLACLIAACSAVLYSPYQVVATASALVGTGLIVGQHTDSGQTIGPGVIIALLVVSAGFVVPTWRRRVDAMAAEQRRATSDALERERSRIAQDLHDVVTHNVSMMIVQAGAARSALAIAPDKAGLALRNVESVGRAAMTELRHIMGLLTVNTDNPDQVAAADLLPPPGLAQLGALVDRVRATGTTVELSVSLPSEPLPAGIDLGAYRVVQEALTNVGKHAAGAAVTITIDHSANRLQVEVVDTGGAATAVADSGSGRGLIGMRERLDVYGGSLQAGNLPTAGYRVYAVIPLELP
jgi:signal transduction histidine kinase